MWGKPIDIKASMTPILVEEAVDLAMQREDGVRVCSATLDQDIAELRDLYALPTDDKQWSSIFATRITSRNKAYRQKVKQELKLAAHNLKYMYGNGGEGDTEKRSQVLRVLVEVIIKAFKSNRKMSRQLDELTALQAHLAATGNLSLPDRVFIRKSLPDLQDCRRQLAGAAERVKDDFDNFKKALYVIAFEHELKKCEESLSLRKTIRERVEEQARPAFRLLSALSEQRASLVAESAELGVSHGTAWFGIASGTLSAAELDRELAKYDAIAARIKAQTPAHDGAVCLLGELDDTAVICPKTLPGPGGEEILISTLRGAFTAYERICGKCAEMLRLSEPIVETLDEYLRLLRGNMPVRLALLSSLTQRGDAL
ncbi:hypothetical protein OH77DRAFT_835134 [Trametes cingulata]|nr:hypothetical protein OH77DRAFT_835134 [Trametes cingulata]